MKSIIHVSILVVMLGLLGCGVSQTEYDKLKAENKKLKMELDELKTGEDRLIAVIEKAYKEKKYALVSKNIEVLNEKHPESPQNVEFKEMLKIVKEKELEEKKRQEDEEKEKIRLANLNNTGMWSVRYYVDNFGEPTRQGYITNTNLIKGKFSNTATQNSDLNVKFLITNSSDISIQLYEYAGNNPVKAYNADLYHVFVQDREGNLQLFGTRNREWCVAENTSDRLKLFEENSRSIHNVFMQGGTVKFRIKELDNSTTHYEFNIQNADYYDNAYRKLLNKGAKNVYKAPIIKRDVRTVIVPFFYKGSKAQSQLMQEIFTDNLWKRAERLAIISEIEVKEALNELEKDHSIYEKDNVVLGKKEVVELGKKLNASYVIMGKVVGSWAGRKYFLEVFNKDGENVLTVTHKEGMHGDTKAVYSDHMNKLSVRIARGLEEKLGK